MWFGICAVHLQAPDLPRSEMVAKNSVSIASGGADVLRGHGSLANPRIVAFDSA